MPPPPAITEAEWEIMRVLWDRSPLSATDIGQALASRKDWTPATVKTLVNRLVNKGALAFEARGKVYWYRPNVAQDACIKRETRSLLERVFGGDTAAMLVQFVKNTKLSPHEIAELKRILDQEGRR